MEKKKKKWSQGHGDQLMLAIFTDSLPLQPETETANTAFCYQTNPHFPLPSWSWGSISGPRSVVWVFSPGSAISRLGPEICPRAVVGGWGCSDKSPPGRSSAGCHPQLHQHCWFQDSQMQCGISQPDFSECFKVSHLLTQAGTDVDLHKPGYCPPHMPGQVPKSPSFHLLHKYT